MFLEQFRLAIVKALIHLIYHQPLTVVEINQK